ncbi:WD40-repeat-containing domain protein [Aspergillus karnatakaensis]|uniref:small subunit rRNA maturation protein UTP4 n=1 Tax=Aspergillus karnatakaensis TaxID=1810916 RepID=UPI003CCE2466
MDIHRCRFIPYNPQAINALAFSHPPSIDLSGKGVPTLRLAIGRANGDIELWNPMRGAWFQETVLRGGKDRSIEGLAWTLDPPEPGPDGQKQAGRLRLFSIGYSSTVTEWDLELGKPKRHSSGNYGELWCLAAQPRWKAEKGRDNKPLPAAEGEYTGQHLAAGCADGSIVILSTEDDDLKFLKTLRPSGKKARVLSVTFQNRNTVVAGYADSSIRVFDIRGGQLLRTVSLGKGPTGGSKELLVWSVKALPDGTIVSGDSAGEVRFWDAKNYSLVQRLQGHLADTLDVAVSADGETVLSGGADQRTVVYRKKAGEKGDKSSRWVEVTHRRYHTHDVKTFAVYETKNLSIVVSGGPDASPVILPLREFGKEHHRHLPSLPQIPPVVSSPSSRLVMSFWDREVNIWRVSRGPTSVHDVPEGQRHRLVGKVLIQGEENITSATLSSDGKILVIATISNIKVFSVRRRKGDERGTLRVQKLDAPNSLSEDGARLVTISPDSHWLCIVRPNSDIALAKIQPAASPQEKTQILPQLTNLHRAVRHARFENMSHGTLGAYERTVRCITFSHNSKLLASGDLSGCIDTWMLESATEQTPAKPQKESTDSDEDSDSDEEDTAPILEGQRWRPIHADNPIPRLKSTVALLSFRPPTSQHAAESRLMALTTEHQLVETDTLTCKLSEWSRRNPKAFLPLDFKGVKDRAMGCFWDLSDHSRERLWLYGTSWLWMFDLKQDFPTSEELAEISAAEESTALELSSKKSKKNQKRKRDNTDEPTQGKTKKHNTGAGDKIPLAQSSVFFDSKARAFVGPDSTQAEIVTIGKDAEIDSESEKEEERENGEIELAHMRRADAAKTNGAARRVSAGRQMTRARASLSAEQANSRRWWYTYKYRGILGIVTLSSEGSGASQGLGLSADDGIDLTEGDASKDSANTGLEIAVVERPMWDVDLPDRYVREYE